MPTVRIWALEEVMYCTIVQWYYLKPKYNGFYYNNVVLVYINKVIII